MNYKKMFIKTLYNVLNHRREFEKAKRSLMKFNVSHCAIVPSDIFYDVFEDSDLEFYYNLFLDEVDILSKFTIVDVAKFVNKYEISSEDDIAERYLIAYATGEESEVVSDERYLYSYVKERYGEALAREVSEWTDLAEVGSVFTHHEFLITLTTYEDIKERNL